MDAEYESESDESLTDAIVESLAEAAEIDPLDLPPLYEFVEPDALNGLFEDYDGVHRPSTFLSFQVETWNVFVRADGRIRICDNTRLSEPKPVFESSLA